MIYENYHCFSEEDFLCFRTERAPSCLVVTPRNKINLIDWAKSNQTKVTQAIKELGAIVFSGFDLTDEQDFCNAFTAITGKPPESYKGDTPRKEVISSIYKSTAVANSHLVPLHQEVSAHTRDEMPEFISFFCITPPEKGTGRTLVGNGEKISQKIQQIMPNFWKLISSLTLTYTARYLPSNSLLTKWIRWLNPSFATIQQRFGTENREEIEKRCEKEGLSCKWRGGWIEVSRKSVPGIIQVGQKTLFCNQIHLDKLSPQLCGGLFNYILARILLFPTSNFTQFDVQFEDGSSIHPKIAGQLLDILKEHQEERDWKAGDLMVLNNATTLHGKTPHKGPREILVAMNGSLAESIN